MFVAVLCISMLRGMRGFLVLAGFLGCHFNVCVLSQSAYVYSLGHEHASVSRNHSDAWNNFKIMQHIGHWNSARERRAARQSPLNLPASMPVVGPVVPIDTFKPALGSRPVPAAVKYILHPPPLPTPSTQKMVELQCHPDKIVVKVQREHFGLPDAQQYLFFGTCPVNSVTSLDFYFTYNFKCCNTMKKSFTGRTEYSNALQYTPPASSGQVVRAFPFTIPLRCTYYWFYNSYKAGYRPCPKGVTKFKSLNMSSGIMLFPLNDKQGKAAYLVGQPMTFVVEVPQKTGNERAYINKCYVTRSANPTSTPRFIVIDNYGCMVDSLKNPKSKFVPGACRHKIRFTIGAFFFPEMGTQVIEKFYIHCEVAVGGPIATPSAKACTFDGEGWKELFGADAACSCCSDNCPAGLPSSAVQMVSSKPLSIAKDGQGSSAVKTVHNYDRQPTFPARKVFEDIWDFSDD